MNNVSQHLLSGALSGFASGICLQPFDLLKTRMQQGDGKLSKPRNTMILGAAREVINTSGIRGLWRGTTATLLRNVPGVALYFTGLNQVRTLMAASPYFTVAQTQSLNYNRHGSVLPKLTSQGNLLAGAAARVTVGFVLNPFSVLKARYESDYYAYKSLSSASMSLIRSGPSELLRGVVPSALRDAPYAGLFVVFYEGIKQETSYLVPSSSSALSTGIHGFSAASAGAIATLATHPFDVVKTKMQVRSEQRYHGLVRTTMTIWKVKSTLPVSPDVR